MFMRKIPGVVTMSSPSVRRTARVVETKPTPIQPPVTAPQSIAPSGKSAGRTIMGQKYQADSLKQEWTRKK